MMSQIFTMGHLSIWDRGTFYFAYLNLLNRMYKTTKLLMLKVSSMLWIIDVVLMIVVLILLPIIGRRESAPAQTRYI